MSRKRANGEGSISRRKDGTWQGAITVGRNAEGKLQRRTVYGRTQREVVAKLEAVRREVQEGVVTTGTQTLGSYLDRWLEHKKATLSQRTAELYADMVKRHVKPTLGATDLAKVSPYAAQTLVTGLRDAVGASTANKVRRLLYGALRQAVRWQFLHRNPIEAVEPVREATVEPVIWSNEETTRFLAAAATHRMHAAFYLLLSAGLRRGEVLALTWADLNGDTLTIRRSLSYRGGEFRFGETKTCRGRRPVKLAGDVLDVLRQHRERQAAERAAAAELWVEHDLIFPSEVGRPYSPMSLHHAFKRVQERANVPTARLHDLRHLHVSMLIRAGVDVRTIADRIGHSDSSFTLRQYGHAFAEHRTAAALDLSSLMATSARVAN